MMALVLVWACGLAQAQVATTPGGNVQFLGGGTLVGIVDDSWSTLPEIQKMVPLAQVAPIDGGGPFPTFFQVTELLVSRAGPLVGAPSDMILAECTGIDTGTTPDSCTGCTMKLPPFTPSVIGPNAGGFSHTFNTGPGFSPNTFVCVGLGVFSGAGNLWWITVRGYRFNFL